MKARGWFLLLLGALLLLPLLVLGMKYPEKFYSPGDLVKAHEKAGCMDCHAPFKRVPSASCSAAGCHDGPRIGDRLAVVDLHERMAEGDCLACHTDHKGAGAKITHDFSHSASARRYSCVDCHLSEGLKAHVDNRFGTGCRDCHTTKDWKTATFSHRKVEAKACADCHSADLKGGKVHKRGDYGRECGACHVTDDWKKVTFSHRKVEAKGCADCHTTELKGGEVHKKGDYGRECAACHVTDDWKKVTFSHGKLSNKTSCTDCHSGPRDTLHADAGYGCAKCHKTEAWKPATFDHIEYLPLTRDHNVSCTKCHDSTPMEYKKYTCMNCHVHATNKIQRKHRKEKVRGFFGDCLRCHQVKMNGRRYGTRKVHEGMFDD